MNSLSLVTPADADAAAPRVAAHLERGGLLAYPTETVYGIGSRLLEGDLAALATLTHRPAGKPFLVLVAGKKMLHDINLRFTVAADRLAARFWPGPLTLVLDSGEANLPPQLRGKNGGIAVRWSSHSATSRLIERLEMPISSTSANLSGREPQTDAAGIISEFEDAANSSKLLVLDGGAIPKAASSTLVDCTSSEPIILREGAVSHGRITACLEEVGN